MRFAVLAGALFMAGITQASAETLAFLTVPQIAKLPASGEDAVGDRVMFSDDLTSGGKPAGKAAGTCTLTAVSPPMAVCSFAFVLADGTVSTVFALDKDLSNGSRFHS